MKIAIYLIRDPQTDRVRYVGQTRDLKRRIKQHLDRRCDLSEWMLSELNEGRVPKFHLVDWVDELLANEREAELIREMVRAGEPLFNKQHTAEELVDLGNGKSVTEREMSTSDYEQVAAYHHERGIYHMHMANGYVIRANERFNQQMHLPFPGKEPTD